MLQWPSVQVVAAGAEGQPLPTTFPLNDSDLKGAVWGDKRDYLTHFRNHTKAKIKAEERPYQGHGDTWMRYTVGPHSQQRFYELWVGTVTD